MVSHFDWESRFNSVVHLRALDEAPGLGYEVSMTSRQWSAIFRSAVATLCALVLLPPVDAFAYASSQSAQVQSSAQSTSTPPDQLDSLVAPIALYPDPLLAQVLAASTYPLEIIQLQQWLEKNSTLKDKALADAVAKQPWDASVQALAAMPDLVKRLANDIAWTTDLGNAFLAQQSDVMEAVQRMRKKAQDKGTLKSSEQQKVETTVVENKKVIVIQPSSPDVIYVPTYDPVVVYGPPVYPYPPIYYPPAWYYPAGLAISFGVGVMMGAFWSGGWGYNCGWGGHNNIYINNNNNFNRNTNINRNNVANGNRAGQWQHNPQHRGGAPYGDRATADRFGGSARGDSLSTRQANARQNQIGQGDRNLGANRGAGGDRNVGANRGGSNDRNLGANRGDVGDRNLGADRGGSNDRNLGANRGDAGDRNLCANRGSDGDRNLGANRGGGNDRNVGANRGTNPDQIGNRQVSGGGGSRDSGAFGGAGRTSGSAARADQARGSSSFGGSRGGGARRSGGRRR